MDNLAQAIVVPIVIIILGLIITAWHYSRAGDILNGWARDNGYELVSSRHCWFWRGPFFWSSRGQEVYYVTVRTADGQLREGWVRCGGWFAGMFSSQIEVRWNE